MSARYMILGSLMVMLSSEGFLSQIKIFNISFGISEAISGSAVEGVQTIDSTLLKFSRMCFATCLILLSIDIPQKFTADYINEPLFHVLLFFCPYVHNYENL